MSSILTRRCLIKTSGLALGSSLLSGAAFAAASESERAPQRMIRLNLNENAFGPSPKVDGAIQS